MDITGQWVDALGQGSGFIRKHGKFHNVSIPGGTGQTLRAAQDNGRVMVGNVLMTFDLGGHGLQSARDPIYKLR